MNTDRVLKGTFPPCLWCNGEFLTDYRKLLYTDACVSTKASGIAVAFWEWAWQIFIYFCLSVEGFVAALGTEQSSSLLSFGTLLTPWRAQPPHGVVHMDNTDQVHVWSVPGKRSGAELSTSGGAVWRGSWPLVMRPPIAVFVLFFFNCNYLWRLRVDVSVEKNANSG